MAKARTLLICLLLSLGTSAALADGLFGAPTQTDFLSVDEAFKLNVNSHAADEINLFWGIADGYYLYKKRLSVKSDNAELGELELPQGKLEYDEFFGDVEIYENSLDLTLPVVAAEGNVTLTVGYQGCAHAGLCYPPTTKTFTFNLPERSASSDSPAPQQTEIADPQTPEQDRFARQLAEQKLGSVLGIFLLAGLLLAFTPCVFPMIPILSSIIAGQGEHMTAGRGFRLSLVYVLAMALTYTLAGVLVGLTGANLQIWFQNPWVISAFAVVFVALSFSMFGFYDLQMPNAIQSRLTAISGKQQQGSYLGTAIMGLLSALIVGPCVTAPLIGALIYIAETGDPVVGGLALFALSMGMGAPLLLIGTSAGKYLPKAGTWMEPIKAVFGVSLLALAIWFLERILALPIILALAGILLIGSAMFMGLFSAQQKAGAWLHLRQTLAWLMLVYGTLLIIGASAGGTSFTSPLQFLQSGSGAHSAKQTHLEFQPIQGPAGLHQALAAASAESKPVMLDFYADWCIACKELEAFTFTDQQVQTALQNFVLIQSDVTAHNQHDQALLESLGLFGPPAVLFFDRNGQENKNFRLVGFVEAEQFHAHVERFKQTGLN